MRKNQVNAILVNLAKRKKTIFNYSLVIVVVFVLAFSLFALYYIKGKGYFVSYKESSNIDYKVYLKKNDFFEEKYLGVDNKYIASIIDYINANLEYEISMNDDIDFKYSYVITADVTVNESKNSVKPLYNTSKQLINKQDISSEGKKSIKISENLNIDYNEYNNLIKDFVSVYDLNDVDSTLTINMKIDVHGSCDKFTENDSKTANISLVIPLTTKTVEIDLKNNLVESIDNVLVCQKSGSASILYLIGGILFGLSLLFIIYKLVKYIYVTRSAETIYEIELKKILNYYHSYIQKVNNKIDLKKGIGLDNYKECQFFRLETFTDMLEIRDNINAPILMSSNENNTATYFLILDVSNKAVYIYGLRIKDIKRQMRKNSEGNEEIVEENEEM